MVEEDLLAYRPPKIEFEALLEHAAFAGHFASGLAERLRNSLERLRWRASSPTSACPSRRSCAARRCGCRRPPRWARRRGSWPGGA